VCLLSLLPAGVSEEAVTVAGRCHQQQSVTDAFSMQQHTAVQYAGGAVLRPAVRRMIPSSMLASVRTFECVVKNHQNRPCSDLKYCGATGKL